MRFYYKVNTVLIICILGFFLALFNLSLKESESIFNFLEKKQTGLGFIPPMAFFGLVFYRKKKAPSIPE